MLGIIPIGGIIIWSGAQNAIPQYWALCDGQNGTPDLRNRFIVGAGNEYTVGNTGGSETVTLTIAQMPSHRHSFSSSDLKTDNALTSISYLEEGGGGSTSHSVYVVATNGYSPSYSSQFTHSHTITGTGSIGFTGSSQAHENRPPYYALCFIMRIR